MTRRRKAASEVLVLGRLPESLLTQLHAGTGCAAAATGIDSLGRDVIHSRVLLLGDGVPPADVEALLHSLRESAPTLVLVALHLQGAPAPSRKTSELADVCLKWPEDTERLIAELRAALANGNGRSIGSRLASVRNLGLIDCGMILIVAWAIATYLQVFPPYLLPSPNRVVTAFLEQPAALLGHTLVTASEAAAGFLFGNIVAAVTCVLLYRFAFLRSLSLPLLTGLQALPIVALAPLLTVWLGTGLISKVVMAAVVCFFPLVANLLAAFVAVDRDLAQLFLFHRANYPQTLRRLLLPASYPAVLAGLRISGGLAVVGAIVAEFTGADRGLGFVLLNATYRLQTDRLFVAIILAALLGVLFVNAANVLRLTGIGRSYDSSLARLESRSLQ